MFASVRVPWCVHKEVYCEELAYMLMEAELSAAQPQICSRQAGHPGEPMFCSSRKTGSLLVTEEPACQSSGRKEPVSQLEGGQAGVPSCSWEGQPSVD